MASGAPPSELPETKPVFKWETMRDISSGMLPYVEPVHGKILEVELTSGPKVQVFRSDDGKFYFCHGLTFGGKNAPGGAVSPFSGRHVRTILEHHYRPVHPESKAVSGDILVWAGLDDDTPHSAILTRPIMFTGTDRLAYASTVLTKNGRLPEMQMTLERLTGDEFEYGDSFNVYRQR